MLCAAIAYLLLLSSPLLAGTPTFLFDFGVPGSGDGQFDFPRRLAVDPNGFVFVADRNNNRIQKFASDGSSRRWPWV